MSCIEYIALFGDNSKIKFNKVNVDEFDFSDINIPRNHMMIFSKIDPNASKDILWNFLNRNKRVLEQTRSLYFKQPMESSVAIKYLFEQLNKNEIRYNLSNFCLGAIFTIDERFLSINFKHPSEITLSKYFNQQNI